MPRRDYNDRPRKRSPRDDDESDRTRSQRRRAVNDDEDRPRIRSRQRDDDDYDDAPRQHKKKKKRPAQKEMSVIGLVALVIGVFGLLLSFIPCFGWIAIAPAVLGIIVGFVGLVIAQKSDGRQSMGMPIAGVSVSVLAVVIVTGWMILFKQVEKELVKAGKEFEAEMVKEEEARQKELAKAKIEVKAAPPGTVLRVTAVQFFKAYEDDDERADTMYKNKVLEVTGTFHEVNFAGGDAYVVELRAGPDEFDVVTCNFAKDPETRALLTRLTPGQQVTIRGKCLGDGAVVEACIIIN